MGLLILLVLTVLYPGTQSCSCHYWYENTQTILVTGTALNGEVTAMLNIKNVF